MRGNPILWTHIKGKSSNETMGKIPVHEHFVRSAMHDIIGAGTHQTIFFLVCIDALCLFGLHPSICHDKPEKAMSP
jgi:hypothetical protein